MRRKYAVLTAVSLFLAALLLAGPFLDYLKLNAIRREAETVEEPGYTLVVNGEIVHHDYSVRFDRMLYDPGSGQFSGVVDGVIEVPLFTVFTALGAEITRPDEDLLIVACDGQTYVASYPIFSLVPLERYEEHISGSEDRDAWDTWNLLLPGNEIRCENGEWIVNLAALHRLALDMNVSFEPDFRRGILFITSL